MDVEIAIPYSDDRPCMVTVARPGTGEPLYRIVTPRSGIPQSVAEGLQEARRLFAIEPWPDNISVTDAARCKIQEFRAKNRALKTLWTFGAYFRCELLPCRLLI